MCRWFHGNMCTGYARYGKRERERERERETERSMFKSKSGVFFPPIPATQIFFSSLGKKTCCWCIKSESCDIEESGCLIQLRNREWTWLATPRMDASRRNETADSSISHDALPLLFSFFFCFVQVVVIREDYRTGADIWSKFPNLEDTPVILFFLFTCSHLSYYSATSTTSKVTWRRLVNCCTIFLFRSSRPHFIRSNTPTSIVSSHR